ncbi:MAG TPA: hypothetical protein PLK42_15060 [Casimicrobium sp.]|nr:hypothetical protein [Casimicrobium sp.]
MNRSHRTRAVFLAFVSLFCVAVSAAPVPAPDYASYFDRLPCVSRIGRCFNATVGGKPVTVIAEKAEFEALRAQIKSLNSYVRDVYWIVKDPVDSKKALDITVEPTAIGLPIIGEPKEEPDVTVYALDGQDLESKPEQVARHDVRVSGQPLVTQQETLTQDFLPAGRYVLAIKYLGKDNWDRKWVFVTVK